MPLYPTDEIEALHAELVRSRREAMVRNSELAAEIPDNIRIFCNSCRIETNHSCKAHFKREYLTGTDKYIGGYWYLVGYRFWMCTGCETCILEEYFTDDEEATEEEFMSSFFPERTEFHIEGKYFVQLPEKLDRIYRETVHAFNHDLTVLCAAGLRVLLEGICEDRQTTGRNLEEKINRLAGILPQSIVENLHSLRFIGNIAVHELKVPDREDLRLAIEVCGDLLTFLYELDHKVRKLRSSQVRGNMDA